MAMRTDLTFTILKPDVCEANLQGKILADILDAGFRLAAVDYVQLTPDQARAFYVVHRERPFFEQLVAFMSRSPIMVAALQKDNAVEQFRLCIGATNPANAQPNTIRKKYGTSLSENAIHGSDSVENAQTEIAFFFAQTRLLPCM